MSEPRMTHEQAVDLAAGYVLGALEREDEAAVRDHLATCALAHDEFEVLGGVVPALLELDDVELVEPPASLGARIMAAAAADLAANPRTAAGSATSAPWAAASSAPSVPSVPTAPSPVAARTSAAATSPATAQITFPSAAERTARSGRRRTGAFDWALRIAAVLAIVVSGAYALNAQGQLDRARAFDQAVAAVVEAGQQPGATTVVLAQQKDQHGSGIAAVSPDGSVVLAMRDLQATSGSQTYTAWVIVGKTPVNVGDFSVDASGTRAFTTKAVPTPAGATVAVTLEPTPGNPVPEGPIVSAGRVPSPPPVSS